MDDLSATDFLFYVLMVGGFFSIVLSTIIPLALGKKLGATDYGIQITLPTSLGLLFMGIAFVGLNWNSGDEYKLSLMTIATVIGALGISLMAILMSSNRMYWATPT